MNPLLSERLIIDIAHGGTSSEALDWIVSEVALPALPFLHGTSLENGLLRGELRVNVPLFGEVSLPFVCQTERRPNGALLHAATLADWPETARAWLELSGEATSSPSGLRVELRFVAHIRWPASRTVGDAAFAKMASKTAERTLRRVTAALPAALQAAADASTTVAAPR